jgi:Protein of unknown function (DUF2786)
MTANRDNLLAKIRALLAKTAEAGCTEPEALAALDRARALMDAYAVTEAELQLTKEEKAILCSEPLDTLDPHNIKFLLMGPVAKFCNCDAWQMRRRKEKIVMFCGLPSDVHLATWLLDMLQEFVQAQLVQHLMETLPPRSERRRVIKDFVDGCCVRISDRLDALCKQSAKAATSNGRELVVVKNAAIVAKMKAENIKVSGQCLGGGDAGSSSYKAGRAAGNRASFGRPVTGNGATLRIRG